MRRDNIVRALAALAVLATALYGVSVQWPIWPP
jgi:hypothetical protein